VQVPSVSALKEYDPISTSVAAAEEAAEAASVAAFSRRRIDGPAFFFSLFLSVLICYYIIRIRPAKSYVQPAETVSQHHHPSSSRCGE